MSPAAKFQTISGSPRGVLAHKAMMPVWARITPVTWLAVVEVQISHIISFLHLLAFFTHNTRYQKMNGPDLTDFAWDCS